MATRRRPVLVFEVKSSALDGMRRFLSITMMVAIALSVIAPIAADSLTTQTPACCRANGKHHCGAMHAMIMPVPESDASVPAVGSAPEKCPMRSFAKAHTGFFAFLSAPRTSFLVSTQQFVCKNYLVFVTFGFSSHTDRGPPTA